MNQYINQFRQQLLEYDIQCGGEGSFSALELLWQCYLDMNPLDDGNVREKEETLSPIFAELSVKSADILCDLLYCDIHFIAVVWNPICSISKVCLYRRNLMVKRKGKDKNTGFQISNSRTHNFKELV